MGLEIQIDSLEDMCELMCNNRIPRGREPMNKDNCGVLLTEQNNKCGYELCDECNEWLDKECGKKEKAND